MAIPFLGGKFHFHVDQVITHVAHHHKQERLTKISSHIRYIASATSTSKATRFFLQILTCTHASTSHLYDEKVLKFPNSLLYQKITFQESIFH